MYSIHVKSIKEASLIYQVISLDDLIELKMGASPDYISSITLEMYDEDFQEWVDACDEYGDEIDYETLCNKEIRAHLRDVYEKGEDLTLTSSDDEEI